MTGQCTGDLTVDRTMISGDNKTMVKSNEKDKTMKQRYEMI